MWSEAFEMLDRAERLHKQVFRPSCIPTWEPPVDVLETESAVIVLAALPGVDAAQVEVLLAEGVLSFSGTRTFPEEMSAAVIHRLELPQGRFERQVVLPRRGYGAVRRSASNGCLIVVLEKLGALGG
jgi:HSP20 family molecular chaperone IbpA